MKVITFSIFKGGTGKTTSAVNTAAALVKKGKRVLLADLDQSAQSTKHLGLDSQQSPSLYDVYMGTKPAALAIRKTRFGIDVLSSHPLMAAIEEALEPGDEVKLAEYLTPLKPDYDFILVDAPGHKTKLHDNALVAADLIMVVPASERASLDGVADLLSRLQGILWRKFDLQHQELKILFSMYRLSTNHSLAVVGSARKIWRDNVLNMTIPHSTAFSVSYDKQIPLTVREPNHPGAIAYNVFSDWLINYEKTQN
jgi:chromosome partitioning protein